MASAAGAAAVLIYNTNGEGVFNGAMEDSDIPAAGAGLSLSNRQDLIISLAVVTEKSVVDTMNLIAETHEGNPDNVLITGSHLDSVPEGPGVNDNGSGSSNNLELALATYHCRHEIKSMVRFAWWAAEEHGLLGSKHYVSELKKNETDFKRVVLNLNFDMTASPNYELGIYKGSSGPDPVKEKSGKIQELFEAHFKAEGIPYILSPFTGRSDYGPFIESGIPAGGLATGAEGIKDAAHRTIFGGLANAAFDPCYHAYCDSLENVSRHALHVNLRMSSRVLDVLAKDGILIKQIHNPRHMTTTGTYNYDKVPEDI